MHLYYNYILDILIKISDILVQTVVAEKRCWINAGVIKGFDEKVLLNSINLTLILDRCAPFSWLSPCNLFLFGKIENHFKMNEYMKFCG